MSDIRLGITRDQLAKFLPDHESIKQFELLFSQNTDFATTVANIIIGTGMAGDGAYPPRSGSNYLDGSISLYEDTTLLDAALLELVNKVTADYSMLPTSQIVLADATSGVINVTLPPPIDCFNGGRSFKLAIHKIDASTNAVNILPNASELIVNEATQLLLYEGEILNFITDGTNWYLGA